MEQQKPYTRFDVTWFDDTTIGQVLHRAQGEASTRVDGHAQYVFKLGLLADSLQQLEERLLFACGKTGAKGPSLVDCPIREQLERMNGLLAECEERWKQGDRWTGEERQFIQGGVTLVSNLANEVMNSEPRGC